METLLDDLLPGTLRSLKNSLHSSSEIGLLGFLGLASPQSPSEIGFLGFLGFLALEIQS